MSLEFVLLSMLEKPATGYDLKAEFESGAKFYWSAEFGQIYPTLHALQRKGWLASSRAASEKGPAKKVYRRTAKGERALREWLKSGPVMGVERFAYIAQLIHLGELKDLNETLKFLKQLREKQAHVLTHLQGGLQALAEKHPQGELSMDDAEFHACLALQLGAEAIGSRVAWCDRVSATVRRRLERQQTDERAAQTS